MCLISVGQGMRRGQGKGAERSGNEEKSRIWRRVKPRKGILWCGWERNHWHCMFTAPLGSSRAGKNHHSQSPFLPTGIVADLAILRNSPLI